MHQRACLNERAAHLIVISEIRSPQTERHHQPATRALSDSRIALGNRGRLASDWVYRLPIDIERSGQGVGEQHVMKNLFAVLRKMRGDLGFLVSVPQRSEAEF